MAERSRWSPYERITLGVAVLSLVVGGTGLTRDYFDWSGKSAGSVSAQVSEPASSGDPIDRSQLAYKLSGPDRGAYRIVDGQLEALPHNQ